MSTMALCVGQIAAAEITPTLIVCICVGVVAVIIAAVLLALLLIPYTLTLKSGDKTWKEKHMGHVGLELSEPKRDGYKFEGWFEDESFTKPVGKTFRMPRRHTSLYAKWTEENIKEPGVLLGAFDKQKGYLTFTAEKDQIGLRIAFANLPAEITKVTLAEGKYPLEYGGSGSSYEVKSGVPFYVSGAKGLNCVGTGEFYVSPFAVTEINGIKTLDGKSFTYGTAKTYVSMGDSIWTFGENTGGIGNISDYMKSICGGNWTNICTGGTTMANRPGEHAGPYDALDFHALADCIASGDFTSAKGSGLTTNLDENVDSIVWEDVDVITVCYGTNDLAFGGTIDSESDPYDKNTVCGALRYGIETVNAVYPNIKFMVMGILYRYADGIDMKSVSEWNEKMRLACDMVGAMFVPMDCGINKGNKDEYLYDGTHPNAAGKAAIAKTVAKHIVDVREVIA